MVRFIPRGTRVTFTSKKPVTAGKWHLGGVTWDGKVVKFYLDGDLDSTHQSTETPPTNFATITVGANPPFGMEYFSGLIANVQIYDRVLTDAEVRQLHLASGLQGK